MQWRVTYIGALSASLGIPTLEGAQVNENVFQYLEITYFIFFTVWHSHKSTLYAQLLHNNYMWL